MKNLNKSILVVVSILFAFTANAQNITNNAQNKCTVNYGTNNYFTVKASKNIVLEQKGDNVIMGRSVIPKSTSIRNEAELHHLTIRPQGTWSELDIKSSNGYYWRTFYQDSPEGFENDVEEGVYEILVVGYENADDQFYSTYQLPVFENTDFVPTPNADAINVISINGVDENGQPLSEKDIDLLYYDIVFHWSGGDWYLWKLCGSQYLSQIIDFRFNDLTATDRMSIYAWMGVNDNGQKHYFIEYPSIIGGDFINWMVENDAETMKSHEERFALENEGWYYMDYQQYIEGDNYLDGVGIAMTSGFDDHLQFQPEQPFVMVTNIDAKNPNDYEEGEVKIKLAPTVFLTNKDEDIADKIVTPFLFYDANGNIVREPFGVFEGYFLTHDNTPNYFESTPASNLYLTNDSFSNGERTSVAYFQSYNYNEYSSPFGYISCEGMFLFIGENGCQRFGDEWSTIQVVMDGEIVFDDLLYNFNMMGGYFDPEEPCMVQMYINNDHLFYDGVEKTNNTTICYDLRNEDATPPTMTILQIMDENNEEKILLPNYANAHINFAAGDFEAYIHELYGFIDHMQYFAKPNVEVFYSIENGEWTSLEYKEDEAMFHPNYGNFFTIDLSQLDAVVADKWVSLKFIVTDEAGNTQTQELSNVFYAGESVSVNEQTALTHTVYPTPFNKEVRITAAQAVNGAANIMVYNVLGEQVYNKAENCTETQDFVIDGSAWKPGVYFYSISTENGVLQGKIVKE